MNDVNTLPKTTFSGRRFTKKQLRQVQETVQTFKNLSRKELALTICEHLKWETPNGKLKINSALTLLEQLEAHGVVTLPAKRESKPPKRRTPSFVNLPDTSPINETLDAIGQIKLQRITKDNREEWKAYIQEYHYLGYKHPVGAHIGYFIVSEKQQRKLGCLLFTASASWALAPRDEIIGWDKKQRQKLLHLIISNNRFLLFPWVKVPNLASQALSLATKQIGNDWLESHGYKPALIETFVDTTKYSGTCYQAANWQYIGKTKGRGRFAPTNECNQTVKDIYIYPIEPDWQHTLTNTCSSKCIKKKYRNDIKSSHTRSVGDDFVALWENVVTVINDIASQYDEKWQIRKRVINSMLLILLIFRLVCSKNAQSYGTTIDELWDSCEKLGLPLPQDGSIASSSFCTARMKLDEAVFKLINQQIISTYAQQYQENTYKWLGHRLFAVDGSKINLPRELLDDDYKLPSKNANYPQGLLSCLYQVKSQMPYDFDLVSHKDERGCAQQHLKTLAEDDVVIYDRGYFSYVMLHKHFESKIHAVFRLCKSSLTIINEFFSSSDTDIVVSILPSSYTQYEIKRKHPELEIIPIQMRLIKYYIDEKVYCLGTTLVDQKKYNNLQDFIDVYHERWGVEELYKVSKQIFVIEDFHAKSERGVKQEIFAHFALVTMNRIFANKADVDLNFSINADTDEKEHENAESKQQIQKIKTNFKNCIHVFSRNMSELLLLKTKMKTVVDRTYRFIIGRNQKERPGRSYERKSLKPNPNWRPPKKGKKIVKPIIV